MFEFHRGETDPSRVQELLCRGRTDLKTLQMLSQWSSQTWNFGASGPGHPPDTKVHEVEPIDPTSLLMNIINKSCLS